jgi:hypothetical protein
MFHMTKRSTLRTQRKMPVPRRATEGQALLTVANLQERLYAIPSVDESRRDVFQFSPQCPDKSRSTLAFC